jgi:hypothetical protein
MLLLFRMGVAAQTPPIDAAALAAIDQAHDAQSRQRAYRVGGTTQGRDSTSMSLIFVAPDRFHYRETTPGRRSDEIIKIGGREWLKSGAKAWEPAPFDFAGTLREFRSPPSPSDKDYRVASARTLAPATANGASAATYEYVLVRPRVTRRITMSVSAQNQLPLKYRAEDDDEGSKSVTTWDIVYDDSLKVESPATQAVCKTGEECLELGMRLRRQNSLPQAAEFYDKACQAGSWQGCLGYASHLVGLMSVEGTTAADKAKLAKEAVSLLDRVIKAKPTVWRAVQYKGMALMSAAVSKESWSEGRALMTRAQAVAAKATDTDSTWDAVLWPPEAARQ